jgi:hypothetical protein
MRHAATAAVAARVASPCTNVCRLDPASGWCLGCRRSIDEIAAWSTLDDAARRAVLVGLARRYLPTDALGPPALPGE